MRTGSGIPRREAGARPSQSIPSEAEVATVRFVEITCADCGCLVRRGVILQACDRHPECCCRELAVAEDDESAPS
jgi:hypothetical protein